MLHLRGIGFVSIDHNLWIYVYMNISACHCAHAYVHKHIRVCLTPSCHIPSVWQVHFLICAVCHTLRWRGQAASGHQGNVMYLSRESVETALHGADALLVFTSPSLVRDELFMFFIFFLRKTLITESGIGPPAYDSTQNPPHLFQRHPCLLSFPSVPYSVHP